jgi:hypothetical protein
VADRFYPGGVVRERVELEVGMGHGVIRPRR